MPGALKAFEGWTTIAVFAAPCLLVALDQLVELDSTPQVEENRYLAKAPNILEAESLTAFREDFEQFYRDHMGFRDFLIRFNSLFRIHVLGSTKVQSGDASVYIGTDDWLYSGWTLRDYTGVKRLDPGQLAWWKTALDERVALVEAHDARYVFFAAPVKVSIYPEFLPRSVRRADGPLALDQLIDHIGPDATVQVLDLRPPLRAAKDWHPLYWKTDHHWNDAGGAAAVEAVVQHIRRWFPHEPSLVKEELICEETIERSGTSLARIIGLSGSYPETRHTPEHPSWQTHEISRSTDPETGNSIWTNASKSDGLRVVCIGDSFTFALLDCYTHQFAYVRFAGHLPPDYALEDLAGLIEEAQPHLILEERAEWGLLEVPSLPHVDTGE